MCCAQAAAASSSTRAGLLGLQVAAAGSLSPPGTCPALETLDWVVEAGVGVGVAAAKHSGALVLSLCLWLFLLLHQQLCLSLLLWWCQWQHRLLLP